MSYERLTQKSNNGLWGIDGKLINQKQGAFDVCIDSFEIVINRLAELEDKIEQGEILELPCKVGDKVWLIYENQVEIAEIWRIVLTPTYNEFKWFIPYDETQPKDIGSFKTNEIGKTVFLTKAEAEKKLEELLKNP